MEEEDKKGKSRCENGVVVLFVAAREGGYQTREVTDRRGEQLLRGIEEHGGPPKAMEGQTREKMFVVYEKFPCGGDHLIGWDWWAGLDRPGEKRDRGAASGVAHNLFPPGKDLPRLAGTSLDVPCQSGQ